MMTRRDLLRRLAVLCPVPSLARLGRRVAAGNALTPPLTDVWPDASFEDFHAAMTRGPTKHFYGCSWIVTSRGCVKECHNADPT